MQSTTDLTYIDTQVIRFHIERFLSISVIFIGRLPAPEADLGLLQHPRWSAL